MSGPCQLASKGFRLKLIYLFTGQSELPRPRARSDKFCKIYFCHKAAWLKLRPANFSAQLFAWESDRCQEKLSEIFIFPVDKTKLCAQTREQSVQCSALCWCWHDKPPNLRGGPVLCPVFTVVTHSHSNATNIVSISYLSSSRSKVQSAVPVARCLQNKSILYYQRGREGGWE